MKKTYLLSGLALAAGAIGIALRRWQLNTAFEADTGLPISGSPATMALAALSIGIAVMLFFLAKSRHSLPLDYQKAFHCSAFPYFLLVCAGGILTGMGGLLSLMDWRQTGGSILQLIFSLLAIVSAICLCIIGARNFKLGWRGQGSGFLLAPGFANCLWLMVSYQDWARDPVVSDYVFALFAIMSSMLAYYYMAAYSFGLSKERMTLFTGSLAVYFSMIALTDPAPLATRCFYLAAILYLLPNVIVLSRNSAQIEGFSNPNISTADAELPLKEEASDESSQ